jgi:putative ABC transport system substrate-binding protein
MGHFGRLSAGSETLRQAQCRLWDSRFGRRRFLLGAGAAGLALAFGCGLAAELVGFQVSAILAADTSAALAARSATQSIPIVSVSVDPVALGLVASQARPGGNVTGLSLAALTAGKRLELLKEFSPAASRVVALWYAPSPSSAVQLREAQEAAPRLGLQLQAVGIQSPDNFETAFQSAARARADGLYVAGSPEMNAQRARIVEFAASTRLPAMYVQRVGRGRWPVELRRELLRGAASRRQLCGQDP